MAYPRDVATAVASAEAINQKDENYVVGRLRFRCSRLAGPPGDSGIT